MEDPEGFCSYGERGGCGDAAVYSDLPCVRDKLHKYLFEGNFQRRRYRAQFEMAPTSTITVERLLRRKKEKQRFTVPPCANADVFKNFDLMITGNANKPRSSTNRAGFELKFGYHANKKS